MADKKEQPKQPLPEAVKQAPARWPEPATAVKATPAEVKIESPRVPLPKPTLTHEPSGEACTLTHVPNPPDPGGPCIRCRHCKVKLRPHQFREPCPARKST
jgi:hypothetical protein